MTCSEIIAAVCIIASIVIAAIVLPEIQRKANIQKLKDKGIIK